MLFLLAVLGVALRYGRGAAALASVLNVAAFDYFFVPPRLSFGVADIQYVLTFGVMLAVGLIVGQLTAGLRFQARIATHRERRSHSLFEVARDLSSVLATEQVVEAAERAVAREFRARVHIFVLDAEERLQSIALAPEGQGLDAGTARWAFDHAQAAGLGTDTLPGSAWLYLPLKAPMRSRGVLALAPEEPRLLLVPEQRRQLETFAALTAIALERVHYVDVAQTATVQIESERLRNSLLAALSHDLRTPLAGLVGLAESLRLTKPPLSGEQREIAEELQVEALRMSTQVNNLLDMARIESGEVRLRREWQSVEEIVGSAVRATARVLAPRPVTTDLPADLPLVECDAVLIERVFVNLLENAAKYTPPTAGVRIAARAEPATMRISVTDSGSGVRPGQETAIFEKFTRGVRESAVTGVGLGLAICKAIVEAHGGTIGVENVEGGGASFVFTLPLGSGALARHGCGGRASGDGAGRGDGHGDVMAETVPVVLLVEDERHIRRFLRTSLEAEGWRVFEAETLRQGLVDAATRKPDLVIADLGLPDGDGVDLIRELRAWSSVPVLVLSARSDEGDKVRALDAGADDYIEKPFGVSELLARVRANRRRQQGGRGGDGTATVTIGDVEVDLAARIVKKAGIEVHLTPIEYRLLGVLIANSGRVLTHRHLLREVWGPSHVEQNHYLRVFMGSLRHKLEDDPAQPTMLVTETGVGYRLVAGA